MDSIRLCGIFYFLVLVFSASAQNEIEENVKRLGSDNFKERKVALRELWESGLASVEELTEAANSNDPELAGRARFVLRRISLHLTPDTSSEIISLIDGYGALGADGRVAALRKLNENGATFAFLRLWSEDDDPRVREPLASLATQALGSCVQSAVKKGDFEGAKQLLAQFPDDPQTPVRYAEIFHVTGQLPDKIEQLKEADSKSDRRILLACYRRAGKLEKALELARELDDRSAMASLSLLAGNGEPYLRWCEEGKSISETQKTILSIIRDQLENHPGAAHHQAALLASKAEKSKSSSFRNRIFQGLNLTGYFDLTYDLMKEHESSVLSSLTSLTLDTEGYLARYNYPKSEKAREKRQDDRIKVIIKSKNYRSKEAGDIFYLSARYGTLGDFEMAQSVVDKLQRESKKAGQEHWEGFLGRAHHTISYPLLLDSIEDDWKEQDFLKLLEFFYIQNSEDKLLLWKLLQSDEDLNLRQRFDEMAIFFEWSSPTREAREEGWRRMIERGRENEDLLDFVIRVGSVSEPVSLIKEAVLAREDRFEMLTSKQQWDTVRIFIYLRDWDQALKFLDLIEDPESKSPGLVAGIFKKAGREKASNQTLTRALTQVVGNPKQLSEIAWDLALTGCHDEAAKLRHRIAMELPPSSPIWQGGLDSMLKAAKLENDRDKARAVSLAMVLSLARSTSWSSSSDSLAANLRLKLYRGLDLIDAGEQDNGYEMIEVALKPLVGSYHVTSIILEDLDGEKYPELQERVFKSSYRQMKTATEKFPGYATAHNAVAWLCAVTKRKLEEAKGHSEKSIEIRPYASYCDTLARIHRYLGNREKELHWQEFAVKHSRYTNFSTQSSILRRYDWILENP